MDPVGLLALSAHRATERDSFIDIVPIRHRHHRRRRPSVVRRRLRQALHRIGQTLPLTVWWFVAVDTVEEDILNVLDVKKQNVSACTDGEDLPSKELLTEILKRMSKRHAPED